MTPSIPVGQEARLRALEGAFAALSVEQAAVRNEVRELRANLLGDPTRQDPAGRGALVLLQESITVTSADLSRQLTHTTSDLRHDFVNQTTQLSAQMSTLQTKLAADEATDAARKVGRQNRRFQVFLYVGGGLVVAVTGYLLGLLGAVHL